MHTALKSSHWAAHIFFHLRDYPSSYPTNPPKTHQNRNIMDFFFKNLVSLKHIATIQRNPKGLHPKTTDIVFKSQHFLGFLQRVQFFSWVNLNQP
jgi:hypothetical protein